MISVYSDGSSSGAKGGPGGYGWAIVKNDEVLAWGYGGSPNTTNNLMELEGAIQGLEVLLELGLYQNETVELVSDSQYTLGMASGGYNATTNLEQVERLQKAYRSTAREIPMRARWVRGHDGEKFNELCDKLAKQGKLENTPEGLKKKPRRVTKGHGQNAPTDAAGPQGPAVAPLGPQEGL